MKYLILVQLTILELLLSFILEGDNDETNEDIDHEECDDNDIDKEKDGHAQLIVSDWTSTWFTGIYCDV